MNTVIATNLVPTFSKKGLSPHSRGSFHNFIFQINIVLHYYKCYRLPMIIHYVKIHLTLKGRLLKKINNVLDLGNVERYNYRSQRNFVAYFRVRKFNSAPILC